LPAIAASRPAINDPIAPAPTIAIRTFLILARGGGWRWSPASAGSDLHPTVRALSAPIVARRGSGTHQRPGKSPHRGEDCLSLTQQVPGQAWTVGAGDVDAGQAKHGRSGEEVKEERIEAEVQQAATVDEGSLDPRQGHR